MIEWNTAPRILNPAPDEVNSQLCVQATVGKELTVTYTEHVRFRSRFTS